MSILDFLDLSAAAKDALAWRRDAACAAPGVDARWFYPARGHLATEAKRICAGCSVRADCLDFALTNFERNGIWAGCGEKQLRVLQRLHKRGELDFDALPPVEVFERTRRKPGSQARGPKVIKARRHCSGKTARGEPCGRAVGPDRTLCVLHGGTRSELPTWRRWLATGPQPPRRPRIPGPRRRRRQRVLRAAETAERIRSVAT